MQFQISGLSFSVSEPYAEGHLCSDGEARALNSARAERIRESARRWIVDASRQAGTSELSLETLEAIRTRIFEFDSSFVFGQHGPRAKSNLTVESEARAMATHQATSWAETCDPRPSEDEIEAQVVRLVSDPRVLDEARRRVAAKTQVAREMLGEML